MNTQISEIEQEQLIEKLEIFKIHGRDKRGRKILRIIGKFFPARFLSLDVLKKYLDAKIFPRLGRKPFAVLYVHTGVQRSENFPGISSLRAIYDAIPVNVRDNLQEVYFLHPGLQSRLFLATCGRFLFSGGLYGKLRYISRVDYLWEHVRRNEIEMPEFVYDHDDDLEYRPMMDYGQESDHARIFAGATVDSSVSSFSMREETSFTFLSLSYSYRIKNNCINLSNCKSKTSELTENSSSDQSFAGIPFVDYLNRPFGDFLVELE